MNIAIAVVCIAALLLPVAVAARPSLHHRPDVSIKSSLLPRADLRVVRTSVGPWIVKPQQPRFTCADHDERGNLRLCR